MAILKSLLFATFLSVISGQSPPSVQIKNGIIQGTILTSYKGRQYMNFDGIPYAQPPIGPLRFEPPQPAEPWNNILIANKQTTCIQVTHAPTPVGGKTTGVEDCLHISVKVPGTTIDATKNYDVLVYIHGGGFSFGSGSHLAGNFTMDRDIILVSMNYRVGLFGFLSTEDAVVPGNMALKDQVLALKWVQDNIAFFGGNPNSVTINGLSAGASSVHYHILSPMSKSLFHKAIAMSGTALRTMQGTPRKKAMTLGKMYGCNLVPTEDLIKCLKSVPANTLIEAMRMFRPFLYNPFAPFSAVVDKWSDEPFFPVHPERIIESKEFNHVPLISSCTADEGLYPGAELTYKDSYLPLLNQRWKTLAPAVLMYEGQISEIESDAITDLIRKEYLGIQAISKRTFKQVITMISDRYFDYTFSKSLRLHSRSTNLPIYAYKFNYTPEKVPSISGLFSKKGERLGISHGDDNVFLYGRDVPEGKRTARDEKMTDFFLDVYVQFMRSGTILMDSWVQVKDEGTNTINYLQIQGPEIENMWMNRSKIGNPDFWDRITLETK